MVNYYFFERMEILMKKKFAFTSLITFLIAMLVAVPVFAATGSTSFNLVAGGKQSLKQALQVNSSGSVTVSVNGLSNGSTIRVVVYNIISGNELSATFTQNNQSRTFTNLRTGEYNIRIENIDSSPVSGSIGFNWTGSWGKWIE